MRSAGVHKTEARPNIYTGSIGVLKAVVIAMMFSVGLIHASGAALTWDASWTGGASPTDVGAIDAMAAFGVWCRAIQIPLRRRAETYG